MPDEALAWIIKVLAGLAAIGGALYQFVIRPLIARMNRIEADLKQRERDGSSKRKDIYDEIKAARHSLRERIGAVESDLVDRMHKLELKVASHLKNGE